MEKRLETLAATADFLTSLGIAATLAYLRALALMDASASRNGGLDRLLQHELALLRQGLCLVYQHREQPGELHLKPDAVVGDIQGSYSCLSMLSFGASIPRYYVGSGP